MNFAPATIAMSVALSIAAAFGSASAQTGFVAPAGFATVEGTASTQIPLGNGGATDVTSQFLFGTSQLGSLPVGGAITAIGFRVNANSSAPTTALTFSNYQISLGGSTRAVGSLTASFAANQAANTTVVRSGALTIPLGSFTAAPFSPDLVPNPFYSISFATPFTYTGGDLLLTLSYATTGTRGLILDGVPLSIGGLDSVSNISPVGTLTQFYGVPVVQFTVAATAAVPEPATWAMMIVGSGVTGAAMRRRRRSGAAQGSCAA